MKQDEAHYQLIERAIHFIEENSARQPELSEVAAHVGLSEHHFQRIFTQWAGVSPKRFLQFLTKEHAKRLLDESDSLLDAAYRVGLSSLGRLHDLFIATEAVTPGEYKSRGAGVELRYGLHATPFGTCLLAATARGICHLSFVEGSEDEAIDALTQDWEQASIKEDKQETARLAASIFTARSGAPLKIHLRGTNFQIKVWEALLDIPSGEMTTYGRLAARLGNPLAARAVGSAVGQNHIAYLIPCHRVIRKSGEFGNYRYGAARKKAMLFREYASISRSET